MSEEELLAPICNMGGGQLAALRAAMSRMEELTQTGVSRVLVERVGRAWVVSTGAPESREVFLWANYTHSREES